MKHDFSDIELAYDSVLSQAPSMCVAYISRTHGTIFYLDDATGVSDELPEDFETSDDYLEIPHKNDLDLGVPLVKRFIGNVRPELSDDVRSFFHVRARTRDTNRCSKETEFLTTGINSNSNKPKPN